MSSKRLIPDESLVAKAEKAFFRRQRKAEESFGVYRKLVIAQTTSSDVVRVCQDGGVVTTLLMFALEKGMIDGALVTGVDSEKPFYPVPKLATTPTEVLEAASSKYTCSQNPLTLLTEAKKLGKSKLALVGTPCQIQALRRLQLAESSKVDVVQLSVGLMCSGCFNHELVTELIQKKLNIKLDSIVKMNIKSKLLITANSGITQFPLSEIKPYKRKNCEVCRDFSSELADVSVGGLGLEDWTFAVLRSEKGEELFTNAVKAGFLRTKPINSDDGTLKLLVKLSRKKSERNAEVKK
jgi:coenzyme F420 hydrogenase subunit beta